MLSNESRCRRPLLVNLISEHVSTNNHYDIASICELWPVAALAASLPIC